MGSYEVKKKIGEEGHVRLFREEGLICLVLRMAHSGCLNGYVAVPRKHPLYGMSYEDKVLVKDPDKIEFNGNYLSALTLALGDGPKNRVPLDLLFNVHGGLTFSNNMELVKGDVFGEKLWWFGFDTAHAGDMVPEYDALVEGVYRDMDYVVEETKKLAKQLASFEKDMSLPDWKKSVKLLKSEEENA
jgi:hypothetical protein